MMFKFTFNNLKISLTAVLLIIIGQVFAFDYYYDGFEKDGYPDPWGNNDNLNPDKWKKAWISHDSSVEYRDSSFIAVSSPVREGHKAIRFEYRYGDEDAPDHPTYHWTHVQIEEKDNIGIGEHRTAPIGEECWYGWSIFLPVDFHRGNETTRGMIAQFHSSDADQDDEPRSPNLEFSFASIDGKIQPITLWWEEAAQESHEYNREPHTPFDPVYGGWNDFIVRVKWDWTDTDIGYLQVWHNGNIVVDYTGPTSYNDSQGPYFCMGIYLCHDENPGHDYIIYGDAYRTGNSYDEVNPNREPYFELVRIPSNANQNITELLVTKTEITQGEYSSITGKNPYYYPNSPLLPVENVTFFDAILYCNAKSESEGLEPVYLYSETPEPEYDEFGRCIYLDDVITDFTKNGYRLPTREEWEHAYRANTNTDFFWGAYAEDGEDYAWHNGNANETQSVGTKLPNDWQLYDIAGNVTEWTNSENASGNVFVMNGSFNDDISIMAYDTYWGPREKDSYMQYRGFRVVRKAPDYCESKGQNSFYEWISEVAIDTFSNSSGNSYGSGYSDFNEKVINLKKNNSYGFTLTPGFSYYSYYEYWRIWIDLNCDGDFDDAGELVFDPDYYTYKSISGIFTIPATDYTGCTRMRISMDYEDVPSPCEIFPYGEVEDYTINIKDEDGSFTLIASDFNSGVEGFDYQDDAFYGTNQPYYEFGRHDQESLKLRLGGENDYDVYHMSNGWCKTFTLSNPANVTLSFDYLLHMNSNYESDEYTKVLMSVDGDLYGSGGHDYVDCLVGNGNGGPVESTGWKTFEVDLGVLDAGDHTVIFGGYNNKKTYYDEFSHIWIDNVLVKGQE